MRMRKKKNLDKRMAHCSQWLIGQPEVYKGRWREMLMQKPDVPLYLEIGCGKGKFTIETVEQNPTVLYIALERIADAMIVAMEHAQQLDVKSLFFLDEDAADLNKMFTFGEIDRIYINFCDPWPSNKHARRRLTHVKFLEIYAAILKQGGEIHFKTDNKDLFEYSLFQFPKVGYEITELSRNLHETEIQGIMTDYEEKFYLQGVPIHRCVAINREHDKYVKHENN